MKELSPTGDGVGGGRPVSTRPRPRVLLLRGRGMDVDALAQALASVADVEIVRAEDADSALDAGAFAGVLASPGQIRAMESEEVSAQTSAVLDALGEAVCLFESGGRLVWANRAFLALDRSAADRALDACRRVVLRMTEAGPARPGDAAIPPLREQAVGEDGRTYELLVSPVPAPAGRPDTPARVAAALRDVTELQRTQAKIDALDAAGAELVRLEADAVRQMHAHDRLEWLRKKIVQLAHDLLQFDHFAIWLVDKESQRLELVISTGLPEAVKDVQLTANREGSGISGFVAATGRSYICHDAMRDKRYIKGLDAPGSSLTTPLMMNDRVVGVFNVESSRIGAFTEDDRHFAEIFSRYVAMAVHMLNLLVVERAATSETTSDRMAGALQEPLNDLQIEVDWLRDQAGADPTVARHLDRIVSDLEAIKRRVRDVSRGPKTILGVEKEIEQTHEDPLLSGRRVLIADDDEEIRRLLESVLRNRGANVVTCDNGGAAINELALATGSKNAKGPAQGFALVISDIRMPDRNGYEVFSAARRRDQDLPVILMTGFGYDPHHSIVRASQDGLQCVLFKPFQAERLIEEVHKALLGAPPSKPGA